MQESSLVAGSGGGAGAGGSSRRRGVEGRVAGKRCPPPIHGPLVPRQGGFPFQTKEFLKPRSPGWYNMCSRFAPETLERLASSLGNSSSCHQAAASLKFEGQGGHDQKLLGTDHLVPLAHIRNNSLDSSTPPTAASLSFASAWFAWCWMSRGPKARSRVSSLQCHFFRGLPN